MLVTGARDARVYYETVKSLGPANTMLVAPEQDHRTAGWEDFRAVSAMTIAGCGRHRKLYFIGVCASLGLQRPR